MSIAESDLNLSGSEINRDFLNPFVVDRRVRYDEIYLPGPHAEVREKLEGIATSSEGGLYIILGQRGSGKTSLLYRFVDFTEQESQNCLLVHLDSVIFEGHKEGDESKGEPWETADFLGEIAYGMRSWMEEVHTSSYPPDAYKSLSPSKLREWARQDLQIRMKFKTRPTPPLSPNEFVECTRQLLQIEKRKIILIFDDADVFLEPHCAPGDSRRLFPKFEEILQTFASLAYPKEITTGGSFSVVFATGEGLGSSWVRELKEEVPKTQVLRLPLFTKDETRQLAHPAEVPLQYDEDAVDCLYRATGGHPNFVQWVCSRVIWLWSKSETKNLQISSHEVEAAVESIWEDRDLKGRFKWLFKWSFPKEGRELIVRAIKEGAVDPKTLCIDPSKLPTADLSKMDALREIEFLERNRLRIGLLYPLLQSLALDTKTDSGLYLIS